MSYSRYDRCPKCSKKGLYNYDRNGAQVCRYCKHFVPHGKDDIVAAAEDFTWSGRTRNEPASPKITVQLDVTFEESGVHVGPTDITVEQLEAITNILSPRTDRIIFQTHQHYRGDGPCSCGNYYPSIAEAKRCLGITVLDDIVTAITDEVSE